MEQIFARQTASNACLGYVLFYGKLIWDVVDVALDSFLFYQLELGQLIDENIYRNNHVNNSILAFAVIGSVKLILFHLPFNNCNENQETLVEINDDNENQETPGEINDANENQEILDEIKRLLIWQGLFLEDGPELILEYFYIEKYVTLRPPWYLFGRDIILALIPVYMVYV